MLTFRQYLSERNLARAGAVTAFASKAKQYGDKSEKDFQSARQALTPATNTLSADKRLARIERVLDRLLSGLVNQRKQIGSHVAVSTTGHMMANRLTRRRRR